MSSMQVSNVRKGFSLIELMLVVSIIAILATLGGIRYVRYREYTGGVACNAYLQAVQNARLAYATDHNGATTGAPRDLKDYMATSDLFTQVNGNDGTRGDRFYCPLDGTTSYLFDRDTSGWGNGVNYTGNLNCPPRCNNENSARTMFPNFELHVLGGYRTFNN